MKILITGGASGLGEAITRRLAQNSAHEVWFTYNSSAAKAQELEKSFPNTHGIKCDFKNASDMTALLKKMDEIGFDALVNNAISTPIAKKHFHKTGLEVFRDGFAQNILSTVEITQRAITRFREKKAGRIVTLLTATLVGRPPAGYAEYTAAKAYVHSLAKSWAAENAAYNITSNCISPGFMATKLTSDTDERIVEQMTSQHPLKRLLTTGEVAEAVEFFLGAPLHINGTNLVINAAEML
jgi:NAD(P)-dependent dehydrogenase (short-subunit alcohol dehydrogenase family)